MYVRRLCSGAALAVLAVSVSVLMLPMAAEAFHVIWPQHSAKVANLASDLDHTFKALVTKPRNVAGHTNSGQAAGVSATLVAARTVAAEPSFGQIFASVSSLGAAPASLRQRLNTQSKPSAAKRMQAQGSVSLASYEVQPRWADRDLAGETVALALLFSGNATVSDKQLVHLMSGPATTDENTGLVGHCNGDPRCSIAAAAPIPGAIWLILSVLLGVIGIGYRRRGGHHVAA